MKTKVLVIDDEQGLRDMLSFSLTNEGYEVLTAQNGKDGIQKIAEQDIDIVITDIKMPGMDGVTVLGKIKEIKPQTEVIVATGYGTMETAIESLRKGAADYINKPFNLEEISLLLKKICETKQLKAQYVSLKEMERLKNEFFSVITHELKTPLMAISNVVEMLMYEDGVDDEQKLTRDSSKNKELLKIVERQVEKIRKLVNNILDLAKMQSGFWELKKQNVSVNNIINDSIKEVKLLAENKKIQINLNMPSTGQQLRTSPAEDMIINCDSEQIERVTINLLTNSVKYTQETGEIYVWFEKNNNEIKFVVEDNGKGIDKENLGKVFDKFYRVDQTLKKDQAGFGIGLAICKEVIDLHKGRIWAESDGLGKGSRFIFTLPVSS